jgi:hypothetical protein
LPEVPRSLRVFVAAFLLVLTACATTDAAALRERALIEERCEKLGHVPGSEASQACIATEELNAALARRKDYSERLLRRLDCIDPKLSCSPDVR